VLERPAVPLPAAAPLAETHRSCQDRCKISANAWSKEAGGTMDAKSANIAVGAMAALIYSVGAMMSEVWAAAPIAIPGCPYTISVSGNYVVARNLKAAATCVTVAADTVTIDLRGHTITGSGTGFGITDGGGFVQAVIIANGMIQNFDTGISFTGQSNAFFSYPLNITGMVVRNSTHDGIIIYGNSTVINSKSDNNGADGINFSNPFRSSSAAIFATEANANQGNGIVGNGPTFVTGSTASFNALSGMVLPGLSQVADSQAVGNGGDGINLGVQTGNSVADSIAVRNGGSGIVLLCPSNAVSNTVQDNGSGNLLELPGVTPGPSPACANFNNTARSHPG
jgi:hypothetical protein